MGKVLSKPPAPKRMKVSAFQHAIEAMEALPDEEKELVVDILKKRSIEAERARLIRSAKKARAEFARGELRTMTVDELLKSVSDD